MTKQNEIKAIVGLGNPGLTYYFTPHNIGFLILDQLCLDFHGSWSEKNGMLIASICINSANVLLIKPQTFMNNSGDILKPLNKRGIKSEHLLVIHDEIDFIFGKIALKLNGSARGHNGIRSLITHGNDTFLRLRCGVGRPTNQDNVGDFVTSKFSNSADEVNELISRAVKIIISTVSSQK